MKKACLLSVLILVTVMTLSACGCSHAWQEADCQTPKTCTKCGETEGGAAGHSWQEADCIMPKTCSICGKTEGEALGHTLQEATCDTPAVCSICGETQGEKLSHVFTQWKTAGEKMTRFCKACNLEEVAELDNLEIVKDRLLGEWVSRTIHIISYKEDSTIIQTGYSICFQEDGTYVFQEEQTWTGIWELVKVNLPYYTIELYCNEKMQQSEEEKEEYNYICTIELWENYEKINMMEWENGLRKEYLFIRNDAQTQKEAAEQLVGTWTSELIGQLNASYTQESRVVETGYTVTAHENGNITISMEEEINGTWIYDGKRIENEGTSAERTTYFYSVIGEDIQNSFSIAVLNNEELQFHQMNNKSVYYYYFGKKTAEEMELFIKGANLLPGVWKTTLVEKYDQQEDSWVSLEEEYELNITGKGRYTSNIPKIANGVWAYDGYDPEEGYHYYLMPNVSTNFWYDVTIQDGKAEILFSDGSGYFYIYMEKRD